MIIDPIAFLWTLSAGFGSLASFHNLLSNIADHSALGVVTNGRRSLARKRIRREAYRLAAQTLWLLAGLMVLGAQIRLNPVVVILVIANTIMFLDAVLATREEALLKELLEKAETPLNGNHTAESG